MLMNNHSEDVDFLINLSNITFDGEFGPIEIFDWHGVWKVSCIALLAISTIVTLIMNVIPIHFIIRIQPSPKRPIDILLLYDQVRYKYILKCGSSGFSSKDMLFLNIWVTWPKN